MKDKKALKAIVVLSLLVVMALSVTACGHEEDVNAPANLEIHDSYADVENIGDGKARLIMQGIITNNSELKTIDYDNLPYLQMDGQKVTATYEPVDSEDTDKVAPGKSVVYSISYDYDPGTDHEWGFGYSDETVVSGLDDYVCIKEAIRNFEGKPQITMEDLEKLEQEQREKFEEFQRENGQ